MWSQLFFFKNKKHDMPWKKMAIVNREILVNFCYFKWSHVMKVRIHMKRNIACQHLWRKKHSKKKSNHSENQHLMMLWFYGHKWSHVMKYVKSYSEVKETGSFTEKKSQPYMFLLILKLRVDELYLASFNKKYFVLRLVLQYSQEY